MAKYSKKNHNNIIKFVPTPLSNIVSLRKKILRKKNNRSKPYFIAKYTMLIFIIFMVFHTNESNVNLLLKISFGNVFIFSSILSQTDFNIKYLCFQCDCHSLICRLIFATHCYIHIHICAGTQSMVS